MKFSVNSKVLFLWAESYFSKEKTIKCEMKHENENVLIVMVVMMIFDDKRDITYHYGLRGLKFHPLTLFNDNEDYSPADTIINLSQTIPIAQVLKSKTSKILGVPPTK